MSKEEIINVLQDIFRDVFKTDITISLMNTQNDIEEWDSLNNMILLSEIQKKFNIRLYLEEVKKIVYVKDMVELIERKKENE